MPEIVFIKGYDHWRELYANNMNYREMFPVRLLKYTGSVYMHQRGVLVSEKHQFEYIGGQIFVMQTMLECQDDGFKPKLVKGHCYLIGTMVMENRKYNIILRNVTQDKFFLKNMQKFLHAVESA